MSRRYILQALMTVYKFILCPLIYTPRNILANLGIIFFARHCPINEMPVTAIIQHTQMMLGGIFSEIDCKL